MPRNEVLLRTATRRKLNEPTLGVDVQDELPYWIVPVQEILYVSRAQILDWCRLPYPRHKKGCRNAYGKCSIMDGADTARMIDNDKPKWIVYAEFDVDAHAMQWKKDHPDATPPQCRNSFYWQPKSLTRLSARVERFLQIVQPQRFGHVVFLGESDGVHIWRMATRAGIPLQRIRGLSCCRHMALFCFSKEGSDRWN